VRPGLACIVEVTKLHYLTDTPKHFAARIKCDLYYINHISLALDLKILAKLVRCVLKSALTAHTVIPAAPARAHVIPMPRMDAPPLKSAHILPMRS